MSVVIPSGFAQIVLNYTGDVFASGRAATVLGFGAPGGISVDADVFAGQVVDAWVDHLKAETLNNVTLESVYWATTTQSGFVAATKDKVIQAGAEGLKAAGRIVELSTRPSSDPAKFAPTLEEILPVDEAQS